MSITLKLSTKSIVAVIHSEGLAITGTRDHEQFLDLKKLLPFAISTNVNVFIRISGASP
jgi:hypothetical protein